MLHQDLSSQNDFVDDDLDFTCIIGWAFASSEPASMLLVCPGVAHPRYRTHSCLEKPSHRAFNTSKEFYTERCVNFSSSAVT